MKCKQTIASYSWYVNKLFHHTLLTKMMKLLNKYYVQTKIWAKPVRPSLPIVRPRGKCTSRSKSYIMCFMYILSRKSFIIHFMSILSRKTYIIHFMSLWIWGKGILRLYYVLYVHFVKKKLHYTLYVHFVKKTYIMHFMSFWIWGKGIARLYYARYVHFV